MPGQPWGVRSIPEIDSRYPLWDQPNIVRDVDEGRFYLPDAEEGRRETNITTAVDARPVQVQRLPGNSFMPFTGAMTLGGFFVFGTFHWWSLALASLVAAIGVFIRWLWVGTAGKPEKETKDVGLGLTLPLYASGPGSIGWWAVFITMLAVLTASVCLLFGYYFYWTVRDDFPPEPTTGPGLLWPAVGLALALAAWGLTLLARRWNRRGEAAAAVAALVWGPVVALGGGAALLAGPWTTGLDPTSHSYPATVWLLSIWAALHLVVGVLMQLYCLAGRLTRRITARHDIDLANVSLYWHFAAFTVAITVATIAGFPLVAA
jgi:cytochrome c oxidase subunit I+III